jgi:hypothetical protein
MKKSIDLIGQRFGNLVVLEKVKSEKNNNIKYLCMCDCGMQSLVDGKKLKSGCVKSDGCLTKGCYICHKKE